MSFDELRPNGFWILRFHLGHLAFLVVREADEGFNIVGLECFDVLLDCRCGGTSVIAGFPPADHGKKQDKKDDQKQFTHFALSSVLLSSFRAILRECRPSLTTRVPKW